MFGIHRFDFVRPPTRAWGRIYPNGTWNGMLGQLQRQVSPAAHGMIDTYEQ